MGDGRWGDDVAHASFAREFIKPVTGGIPIKVS